MIARLSVEASVYAALPVLAFLLLFIFEETFRYGVLFLTLIFAAVAAVAAPIWWLSGYFA